jgi:hypothetical protein
MHLLNLVRQIYHVILIFLVLVVPQCMSCLRINLVNFVILSQIAHNAVNWIHLFVSAVKMDFISRQERAKLAQIYAQVVIRALRAPLVKVGII